LTASWGCTALTTALDCNCVALHEVFRFMQFFVDVSPDHLLPMSHRAQFAKFAG
jgi:hypothetical protein